MPGFETYTFPTQYLHVSDVPDQDGFRTLQIEERKPTPSDEESNSRSYDRSSKHAADARLKFSNAGRARRALRRASSEQHHDYRSQHTDSTTDSAHTVYRLVGVTFQRPESPVLRRSSSNPALETRRDIGAGIATLQKRQFLQAKQSGKSQISGHQVRRVRELSGPLPTSSPTSPSIDTLSFKWYPRYPVRSNSDPSSAPQVETKPTKRGKHLPLKPALKRKSKSTTASPPTASTMSPEELPEGQQLRRTKTVDFEEKVTKKLLSLPLRAVWAEEPSQRSTQESPKPELEARGDENKARPMKTPKKKTSCPGPKMKGRPADPAITRTDVHVVAITPSVGRQDLPKEPGYKGATPTMQFVESKAGCYEVVWDDVAPDDDVRSHRRDSSASASLHVASSTSIKGLERVNSKLTEWTSASERDGSPAPFKPQIVVFPDEDGRRHQLGSSLDDEDHIMFAPPNSKRTSANTSRYPSYPASTRESRTTSHHGEEPDSESELADAFLEETSVPIPVPNVVPDPEAIHARSEHLLGANQGQRKGMTPIDRQLSNLEDSEVKFRGHRDSVTIAKSRIYDVGGVSPELFTGNVGRDSVSMAKRTYGLHSGNTASDPLPSISAGSPLASPKIQSAMKGLKNSASASILSPQPTEHRRIRIVE